ncbi:hypothetical protein ACNPQK_06860 [Acinetobacter guillouiae]|uniref:hypothetical protein n=1 Tax=Acinetobacter guillouiae TaxID=106649 RepID=UPI003AF477D7
MKFKKTIELQYNNLKATALCRAKRDVRFYLCGVYVGDGFVAATNGHMALICNEPDSVGMDLIIPGEAIDSLIKKVGNFPITKITKLHQVDKEFWLLEHNGTVELFRPIDGKYPDIKRVDIPKPTEIQFKFYPKFNLEYLSIFQKVAKVYKQAFPSFYPTTENHSAYVEITSDVHGILMPLRV